MVARFERDVCGRTARVVAARARVAQRLDLGVRLTAAMMPAFADRDVVAHENAPDRRVRRGIGNGAPGELARARQIRAVAVYGVTSTPFQKATYPSMFFAFSLVCG
ncbi:MAG: hypothetical protein NVS3B7_03230 [Candidatus Elarobacter sp.]